MEPENRGLDLEKELTCSICTDVLYQPLTLLDCLHTFCGSCLKEWFNHLLTTARNNPNAAPAGTNPYTCPACRAPVRDTKHDSRATTLVDMFVAANPEKGKTPEEKLEIKNKYTPGENVLPKVELREKTLRERRVEDEDRRLMDEVRTLSLREVGVESSEARRERRRREEGRSHGSRSQSSRDNSRDGRSAEDRERRRRREAEGERRRVREGSNLRPAEVPTGDRRRRRSDEETTRRHNEVAAHASARQVEHQSSLRSLISSSDVDSHEMEEEILRQIREEGLLDGIDLENIDVSQEDQISERIAEAFRKRQEEKQRQERARRRSDASRTSDPNRRRRPAQHSAPESREASGDDAARTTTSSARRTRTHSRATSAISGEEQSRPPPSSSAFQAAHLEVNSSDEGGRRRRRTTSSSRSATTPIPVAEPQARPAARSQTDLSNRPQSTHAESLRPSMTENSRSSTDPITQQAFELPAPVSRGSSRPSSQHAPSPNASPRIGVPASRSPSPEASNESKIHAELPAELFVPSSVPSAVSQQDVDQNMVPAPLSPRVNQSPRVSHHASRLSLSDRATAMGSASRPTSSSSPTGRSRTELFPEPSLNCARCDRTHIEYELHYNCGICSDGNFNICQACYRKGLGCLHWYGFGQAAWRKWNMEIETYPDAAKPHMLRASRYLPPPIIPGGADGRRTLTPNDPQKRLQSGVFCCNCSTWANECYWQCATCNEGDWGFCNSCVNQGKSCTHSLLPMTYEPQDEPAHPPISPTHGQQMPSAARILTGPGVHHLGPFQFLTFSTSCDICHYPIQPSTTRYHCYECTSRDPANLGPGDYDICTTCYPKLVSSRRISAENGHNGWRRCLQGHRMIVCGFEDDRGGQCRVVVQDLVGGRDLVREPSPILDTSGGTLMQWSWSDGQHVRTVEKHKRLVTTDVMKSAPSSVPDMDLERGFPPDGGVGMRAVALWSWWPAEDADDELLFPKGAEVRECMDVNEDWFHGVYMGARGLFPSNFVRVIDSVGS